jgi:hypothetical protein
MATIQLGWKNFADSAVLSGGSWSTTLPLANLQKTNRGLVARSGNALAASTKVNIDLQFVRSFRGIGLLKHNASQAATYEITAGTTPGGSDVYASGAKQIWAATPTLDLSWEDANFWLGTVNPEDIEGYPIDMIHDIGENIRAQYLTIQITDTGNPAGYFQSARLLVMPLYSPPYTFSLGARFGWEPRSEMKESLGGVAYFDRRTSVRVLRFGLPALARSDTYGQILELQRIAGNAGEVLVIQDADDEKYGFKRNFAGYMSEMDELEMISHKYHRWACTIKEIV